MKIMYCKDFVCVSLKHGIWYHFSDHRWKEISQGHNLVNKCNDEIIPVFKILLPELKSADKKINTQMAELNK
jgi:hypothetical protein